MDKEYKPGLYVCPWDSGCFATKEWSKMEEHLDTRHEGSVPEYGVMVPSAPVAYNPSAKPSEHQVGGDHYKSMKIQPSDFIYENKLGWHEGNAIKYICRHHLKGGAADIDKAIHYLNLLKEKVYGK